METCAWDAPAHHRIVGHHPGEVNRARIERSAGIMGGRRELAKVQRDLDRAIQAILDGVPGSQLRDKTGALKARKAELAELLANAEEPPPVLHPNMAEIYRQRISALYERLQDAGARAEAAEVFSGPWSIR
jgi:site-specific DNA recombinase